MTCAVTLPWPCESAPAGGTHPLGAILCARHLAAVLAPLRPPVLERVALRRHHHASTISPVEKPTDRGNALDPALTAAIVALAPLGATLYEPRPWYPSYDRLDHVRMPCGVPGEQFEVVPPRDPRIPATGRAALRRAIQAGWGVRATISDGRSVMIKCEKDGELMVFIWLDGHFTTAWRRSDLTRLGLRAAQALL